MSDYIYEEGEAGVVASSGGAATAQRKALVNAVPMHWRFSFLLLSPQ